MIDRTHYWVSLLVVLLSSAAASAQADQADTPKTQPDPLAFEVQFHDDSVLRVRLAEERIEIATKHGKLSVPADKIKRLYVAQRIDDASQQQIDQAIEALADPAAAPAASDRLLALKELAYPALQRAAKDKDPVRAKAAAQLQDQLRKSYKARVSTLRDTDLIETTDDKIVGRLTKASLRIETQQFGELLMKLADTRSLRSQSLIKEQPKPEPGEILPSPGTMKQYETLIDKTFRFRVTGQSGSCWGTDVYTTDSQLSAAAVHAGVLELGETGVVEVKVIAPPPNFIGSFRNGITTRNWGQYPGAYQILKPKKRPRDD